MLPIVFFAADGEDRDVLSARVKTSPEIDRYMEADLIKRREWSHSMFTLGVSCLQKFSNSGTITPKSSDSTCFTPSP